MLKPLFTFSLVIFFFSALAQKKSDTLAYYINKSGAIVSSKESAAFILFIKPPDVNVDSSLFIVNVFYKDGKLRLAGNSLRNSISNLRFEGPQITFFPNGHKMKVTNFNDGLPAGRELSYYPNGKLYTIRTYIGSKEPFLTQCNDSTGNVLADNGNGRWIIYDDNFKDVYAEGQVSDGAEVGVWKVKINDAENAEKTFEHGKIIKYISYKKDPLGPIYTSLDTYPTYPGGLKAFYGLLNNTIHYPPTAREDNIQGRVDIQFVVEVNGTLSNFSILKSVRHDLDEEALRCIRVSRRWNPGMQDGKAVRAVHMVPISFTLSQ